MIIHLHRLPDPALNPNKRLHFYKLAAAKRNAKEEMIARVIEQVKKPYTAFREAHIIITWVAKDNRRRDIDNLFASMKPYIDGLVAYGILTDDSADLISYTLEYEKGDENDTIIEICNASESS
jgi:Holliday junction resolvase RusA-like endonuclease